MKPKSISRFLGAHNTTFALVTTITAFAAGSAFAAQYKWVGTTNTTWATATNWTTGTGLTAGPAPTGSSTTNRLSVNNTNANSATYNFPGVTTTYAADSASGARGLVIGSGSNGSMVISGGTFSTLGGVSQDVIGNGTGFTGTLTIDGTSNSGDAQYIGTNLNTDIGLGFGSIGSLSVKNGSATVAELRTNNTTATVTLETGGTLAMNKLTYLGGGNTNINFNGGTLKARVASTSFIATPSNGSTTVSVKSGGAIIDTNTFDITIARPILTDAVSLNGGITKNSAGLLTLGAVSTTTGPAIVNAGGLSVSAGAASWKPSSFTHSGNLQNFSVGVYNPTNLACIDTAGALTLNSAITVNVIGSQFVVGQIPLIKYGSKTGVGSLTLNTATLPPGVVATLQDNGSLIYLDVTQGGFVWSGASATPGTGDWDITSLNWNAFASAYTSPAPVTFPNIAGGGTITLNSSLAPAAVDFTNSTGNDYTLAGPGKVTGASLVNKSGTGKVTFSGTNDYTGNTTITNGILSIATTASLPGWDANSRYPVSSGATLAVQNTITDANVATMIATTGNFASGSILGFDVAAGDRTFASNLSGALGVTVVGGNVLTLSGNNSHTGTTLVSEGTIKAGSVTAFTGTGALTVSSTGTLDLAGFSASFTNLNSSAGTIITSGATAGTDTLTFSALTTNGTGALFTDDGNRKLALNLTSTGVGVLTATTNLNNTYSGGLTLGNAMRLTVLAGTIGSPGAIDFGPYGKGTITINGGNTDATGTQIWFNGSNRILMNDVIVNGNAGNGSRAGSFRIGTNAAALTGIEISGNINANLTDVTFGADSTADGTLFTLSGKLTGLSGFRFFQSANAFKWTTVLNNATASPNDYAGNTSISNTQTTLALGAADQIPNGTGKGNVAVNFGTLDLAGFNETINGLSGGATATVDNVATGTANTLTLGDGDATGTAFSGVIKNTTGTLSLTKIGNGTQALSGLNTYGGSTTVNAGTLQVNSPGSLNAASAVTVNGGALGGTGTVSGSVTVGALGTIAPGVTIGALSVASANLSAGGTLAIGIDDTATPKVDLLVVTGALNVTNAKLAFTVTGTPAQSSYVIATAASITGTIAPGNVTGLPAGYQLVQTATQIRLDSVSGGYSLWAGTNAGSQESSQDFDYDGVTNGVEFFMNAPAGMTLNPAMDSTNKVTWSNGGNIPSAAYGTQFVVQISSDLAIWTNVPSNDPNLINSAGSVSYTVTGTGKRFARLQVTPN